MATERTDRVTINLTNEQKACLDKLAEVGIHGRTAAEVGKVLIVREIERLISDGFLKL